MLFRRAARKAAAAPTTTIRQLRRTSRRSKRCRAGSFFSRYTAQTKLAAGGEVEVLPLEIIAETQQGLRQLMAELVPLLVELTGPVVLCHLAQIPELRERGLVPAREERS